MLSRTASPLDDAFGLPLHPLAVHAPVVLLPLGAIGILLVLFVPRWRAAIQWPVLVVLALGAISAFVAKLSGEALAEAVGRPVQHEELGNWTVVIAVLLLAGSVAWTVWQRRRLRLRREAGMLGVLSGILLAALAVVALIVTVLTGHTGAEAVWSQQATAPTTAASTEPSESASDDAEEPSESPTASAGGITLADINQHDDAASCWTAIEGTVYDLTDFIAQHPGGSDRILGLCGIDGSEAFAAQHEGAARPAEMLSQYAIGALAED